MLLQYLAVQLLLILFWIDMCVGQIVFEEYNRRSPDSSCTTPDRRRGNCERWTKCKTLSQKINGWDDLRPYLCGFAGTEPMVCCPSSPPPNISGGPTDTISPTNTNSRTGNTASENGFSIPRTNPSGSPETNKGKPIFLPD
ncbi:hypothetical protein AVEN_131022-1, partial [Araneus ventricosus]